MRLRARAVGEAAVDDLPILAIVGRPNVGKSTLFNRLARKRIALVHDQPGVTRDRHYAMTSAHGVAYRLVDTGGFDPEDEDPMKVGIATHVRAAIEEADVVLLVTDAQEPLAEADRAAVDLLRRSAKPALYAANKADSSRVDAEAFELYRLGVRHVLPISALHGRGVGDLENAVIQALQRASATKSKRRQAAPKAGEAPRIAIVGRPNAGKSTLFNRLAGSDRALVDDRPGTTRDAIDVTLEHAGRSYTLVDTAGLRRKAKVAKLGDAVEAMSVGATLRAIEEAQVVVVVCDASEGAGEQDAKIVGLAEERGRAIVAVLNKSDLGSAAELKKAEERLRETLAFASYVPIVRLSAKTGRGIAGFFEAVDRAHASFLQRVSTGELNRFFEQVLELRAPPTTGNVAPRIYFVTQATVGPPTFVAMTNAPDAIHFSYRRFVVNQLRKRFGFEGSPVRVIYRARRRAERGARRS